MKVQSVPTVGFVTRTGRKVYGQKDYDRYRKMIQATLAAVIFVALVAAIGREF